MPRLGQQRAAALRLFRFLAQPLAQRFHALAGLRRNRHIRCGQPCRCGQVGFVEQDPPVYAFRLGQRFPVLLRERLRRVEHHQREIRVRDGLLRALHTDFLGFAVGLAQPGCVSQVYAHAGQLHCAAHRVARRSGLARHDGALLAQQRVQQRTLAHVRAARDDHVEAGFQHARAAGIAGGAKRP